MRQCTAFLEYQQMQQKGKCPYELSCRPWEMLSANIFMINSKMLLCFVDYYIKILVVKKVGSLAADDLVKKTKMIFAEYGLPKRIISNAGMNFTSEMLKQFCEWMSVQQSVTSSYHHWSNSQVEAYVTFLNAQ